MAISVFEDREGVRLIYRNQLILVKMRRKIAAFVIVDAQASRPQVGLVGSMDSPDAVFYVLRLRGGVGRKAISGISDFTPWKCVYGAPIGTQRYLAIATLV